MPRVRVHPLPGVILFPLGHINNRSTQENPRSLQYAAFRWNLLAQFVTPMLGSNGFMRDTVTYRSVKREGHFGLTGRFRSETLGNGAAIPGGEEKSNRDSPKIKKRLKSLKTQEKTFSNRDSRGFFLCQTFASTKKRRNRPRHRLCSLLRTRYRKLDCVSCKLSTIAEPR